MTWILSFNATIFCVCMHCAFYIEFHLIPSFLSSWISNVHFKWNKLLFPFVYHIVIMPLNFFFCSFHLQTRLLTSAKWLLMMMLWRCLPFCIQKTNIILHPNEYRHTHKNDNIVIFCMQFNVNPHNIAPDSIRCSQTLINCLRNFHENIFQQQFHFFGI